jgi:diguanylate cyclase (GGDEF)-like protein/PAS domain S-box-containing protein
MALERVDFEQWSWMNLIKDVTWEAVAQALHRWLRWVWQGSFARRLAISIVWVHVAITAAIVWDMSRTMVQSQAQLMGQSALVQAELLALSARAGVLAQDANGLGDLVQIVKEDSNLSYAVITDGTGWVLAHSSPELVGQMLDDELSRSMRAQNKAFAHPAVSGDGGTVHDAWAPVRDGVRVVGWVRLGSNSRLEMMAEWQQVLREGWVYGLVTVLAGGLLALAVAHGLGRDVRRMQQLFNKVRQGQLDERLPNTREDELGDLMRGVNATMDRLSDEAVQRRRAAENLALERSRLAAVLSEMNQGVLIEDTERRVALCNRTFCELLQLGSDPAALLGHDARELMGNALTASTQGVLSVWRMDELVALTSPVTGEIIEMNDGRVLARDYQPIEVEGGRQGVFWSYRDITEQQQVQQRLQWQAMHDPLTHLPNRLLLNDRMGSAMVRSKRLQQLLAICMLDLDLFKQVNDQLGHEAGDELLKEVAHRLKSCTRGDDTVARLGGDEFVLLLGGLASYDEMDGVLSRVRDAIAQPYQLTDADVVVSASIGVTLYPLNDNDADTLLRHADQAMYHAKQNGGNAYHLFDIDVSQQAQHAVRARARVREAIEANEMCLHYQPKVSMSEGRVVGAEALVRWRQPDGSLRYPDTFLPAIEGDVSIELLGEWLIRAVLQQQAQWRAQGVDLPVSVNIAARHFLSPKFVPRLQSLLAEAPAVPPQALEIELVESAALHNLEQAAQTVSDTRALGVSVAIDDFGAGYASLGYLRRLPVDVVKIDKSFVIDMLADPDDLEVVQAVTGLARTFRRQVVAEGVETDAHGLLLMRLGCDLGQGYGISRPMPAERWVDWVRNYRPEPLWAEWVGIHWDTDDLPLLVAAARLDDWAPTPTPVEVQQTLAQPHWAAFVHWCKQAGVDRYSLLPEWTPLLEACNALSSPPSSAPAELAAHVLALRQGVEALKAAVKRPQDVPGPMY